MSTLTGIRTALRDLMPDSVGATFDHLPEQIPTPSASVVPGSPYLTTEDVPFGHVKVTLDVLVMVRAGGSNAVQSADLDGALHDLFQALTDTDFDFERVSEPFAYQQGTGPANLAAILTVSTITTL